MISILKSKESVQELRIAIQGARTRNPDALSFLSIASHIPEETIRKIVDCDVEPTDQQHAALAILA